MPAIGLVAAALAMAIGLYVSLDRRSTTSHALGVVRPLRVLPGAVSLATVDPAKLLVLTPDGQLLWLDGGPAEPDGELDAIGAVPTSGAEVLFLDMAARRRGRSLLVAVSWLAGSGELVLGLGRGAMSRGDRPPRALTWHRRVIGAIGPGRAPGGGLAFGPEGALLLGLGDLGPRCGPAVDPKAPGGLLRVSLATEDAAPGAAHILMGGLLDPKALYVDGVSGWLWLVENRLDMGARLRRLRLRPLDDHAAPRAGCFTAPGPASAVYSYSGEQGCGLVPGVVYRGRLPLLKGAFLFGDRCTGELWALPPAAETPRFVARAGGGPIGLVQVANRLLLLDRFGTLSRLDISPATSAAPPSVEVPAVGLTAMALLLLALPLRPRPRAGPRGG